MLHLLDEALEAFLRASLPTELRDIDVAFEAPDGEWGAGLTRPTINLFLRDVRRNLVERDAGRQLRTDDGRQVWERPAPRADCRYLVTAWTSQVDDEHRILGEVMATLLRVSDLPAEYLSDALLARPPRPSLTLAASGGDDQADFWSALGGQLKPGLDLLVTVTVDAAASRTAGPPVTQADIAIHDRLGNRESHKRIVGGQAAKRMAGGQVSSPRGAATVQEDGSFVIRADPGDTVTVQTGKTRADAKVPDAGTVKPRKR